MVKIIYIKVIYLVVKLPKKFHQHLFNGCLETNGLKPKMRWQTKLQLHTTYIYAWGTDKWTKLFLINKYTLKNYAIFNSYKQRYQFIKVY